MSLVHHKAQGSLQELSERCKICAQKFTEVGFIVKYAARLNSHKTNLEILFLEATQNLKEKFGFEYEILLIYSKYNTFDSRTISAVDSYMNSSPAKGRVESLVYFVVSEYKNVYEWMSSYFIENKDAKISIPFFLNDILADPEKIFDIIAKAYFSINKFKDTLPLSSDTYFFGRENEFSNALEFFTTKANFGVFGLRKTGKTSFLLKIKRFLEAKEHQVVFIECQNPRVGFSRWNTVLQDIANNIGGGKLNFEEIHAANSIKEAVNNYLINNGNKRLILLFDEIEQITPETAPETHWDKDFVLLFQSLRSVQTLNRNLQIILAGLNTICIDKDRFSKRQNPLFGIVSPIFLKGFTLKESTDMINKLSKISCVSFDNEAIDLIYNKYGGHPLLTRLACSYEIENEKQLGTSLPVRFTRNNIIEDQKARDRELVFYIKHVINEIEDYYPDEYRMLEKLALGDTDFFKLQSAITSSGKYLYNYGILSDITGYPCITIDVVNDYLIIENARREGRTTIFPVVEANKRELFVKTRINSIINDMRQLEQKIKNENKPSLFGHNSFPLAEKLLEVSVVYNQQTFSSVISILNLVFVESIENYGTNIKQSKYFWSTIKHTYPQLHEALHRIKVYRHGSHHLELNQKIGKQLRLFLEKDLGWVTGIEVEDKYWLLLQRTLDELMRAIQFETAKK